MTDRQDFDALWAAYLGVGDRAVHDAAGYGAAGTPPRSPALLVVDMKLDFFGPAAWVAVPQIARLIAAARAARTPVIYTRRDAGRLAARRAKTARGGEDSATGNEILPQLAPALGDIVLGKPKPSAFWAADLDILMDGQSRDGVILTGCTTSGCIRATAVDAYNRDLPCLIVPEAVFDRFAASHAVALFDLQAKYADLGDAAGAERLFAGAHDSASSSQPR